MEKLLSVKQLAEILNVPKSWIYARTEKRAVDPIPTVRVGGFLRFRESEIEQWLETQTVAK